MNARTPSQAAGARRTTDEAGARTTTRHVAEKSVTDSLVGPSEKGAGVGHGVGSDSLVHWWSY